MTHAHVVGAGLAGLSAALGLAEAGWQVTLHEAGPAAGGRCRSYFDRALGARIDNGNHLLLSGNSEAMAFLDRIGARDSMAGPGEARFPFMDLTTGERWVVAPGAGRVPWWVLSPGRRVPGTKLSDYLALLRLRSAGKDATVAATIGGTTLYRRLLEPLAVSALNTPAETGLAALMWQVVDGSLAKGGAACLPLVPKVGLSESFIDPAIAWLDAHGGVLHTSQRISRLEIESGHVTALLGPNGPIELAAEDFVVLAVPPWVATDLLPGLPAPDRFESILNVHYRIEADPGPAGFIGLVGGTAEWVFVKPGIVSTTTSAANRLQDVPAEELAARIWAEIRRVLGLEGDMPPVRVVREKRATFAATAHNEALRPGPQPAAHGCPANLAVAGDWTSTGLPATIEGAIRSGRTASRALLSA